VIVKVHAISLCNDVVLLTKLYLSTKLVLCWLCSVDAVQSNVLAHGQLDLCRLNSSAIISTAALSDTSQRIDATGSACHFVDAASLIVMPNTTHAALPYHAVAASVLHPTAASSLLGYVDMIHIARHQPPACGGVCVSQPSSMLAPQSCLTTKIRRTRCIAPPSSKFTPYWSTPASTIVLTDIKLDHMSTPTQKPLDRKAWYLTAI